MINEGMNLLQAQEIRNSTGWKHVCIELDYRINALLNELRKCKAEEVYGIQNHIAHLEELKKLPDDVVDRETIPS